MKKFKLALGLLAGIFILSTIVSCMNRNSNPDNLSDTQVKQIQDVVHSYLVAHPEVLVEASQALQQQQMKQMRTQAVSAATQNAQALFADANSPVAGNVKGDITLIEFFDYQCPHCVYMTPIVKALIAKNANLRVVFKEFPIFGANSEYASRVALVAMKLGKYLKFHEALMQVKKPLNNKIVDGIAKQVGLNMVIVKRDINSKAISAELKSTRTLAQQLQLSGTPAFIVGYTDIAKDNDAAAIGFVPGQTDEAQLQKLIDQLKA